MKRKAKELQRQRQDAMKYGRNASGYSGISGGGASNGRQDVQIVESVSVDNPKPSYTAAAPPRSVVRSQLKLSEHWTNLNNSSVM